ncbi:MAG: hypothetical protein EAX96_05055 [Candidatus Lokiarchaeota archaeon]|nr:hypothetical protein [Candidatus Lokiarchaeota archaeon]
MLNGKIRGAYHFYITKAILDAIGYEKFPQYARILKAAADLKNQWYGWEGFLEFLKDIEKLVSENELRLIGIKIMLGLKEGFVSAGYTSADAIIKDYDPLLKKNTKEMLPGEIPKTLYYEPGFATIEFSASQPRALLEGFLIGIIQMFGNKLLSFNYVTIKTENFSGYQYNLKWE